MGIVGVDVTPHWRGQTSAMAFGITNPKVPANTFGSFLNVHKSQVRNFHVPTLLNIVSCAECVWKYNMPSHYALKHKDHEHVPSLDEAEVNSVRGIKYQ